MSQPCMACAAQATFDERQPAELPDNPYALAYLMGFAMGHHIGATNADVEGRYFCKDHEHELAKVITTVLGHGTLDPVAAATRLAAARGLPIVEVYITGAEAEKIKGRDEATWCAALSEIIGAPFPESLGSALIKVVCVDVAPAQRVVRRHETADC